MPEIANVASGETIESAWGNAIRDRTVQRYTSTAERDSLNPGPVEGDLAYIENTNDMQFYNGSSWLNFIDTSTSLAFLPLSGGTMSGAIFANGGSAAVPGYSFATDGNTGLYSVGNDGVIHWSGNGNHGGQLGGAGVQADSGTVGIPAYGFSNDPNTGMFRIAEDIIGWATGGVERFRAGVLGVYFNGTGAFLLKPGIGSVSLPAFAFSGDDDTGMYRPAANQIGLAAGGVAVLVGTATSVTFPNAGTTTNNTLPGWRQLSSSDRSLNALVSGAKFKRGIRDADTEALLTDLWSFRLRQWQEKGSAKNSPWITGMVADEAIELATLEAVVDVDDDGDPYGFDQVNATHNHLVAGVQYLHDRLVALEARLEARLEALE
jgi:hypothetical protein